MRKLIKGFVKRTYLGCAHNLTFFRCIVLVDGDNLYFGSCSGHYLCVGDYIECEAYVRNTPTQNNFTIRRLKNLTIERGTKA